MPLHNEAGTNLQLAERVKSILTTKQLTLHQASQTSATYVCGCCSQENDSLVIHTYRGGVHAREELRSRDAEVIGKVVSVARRL